jgi:glycolate dehydrogenase FAD-linked subunit
MHQGSDPATSVKATGAVTGLRPGHTPPLGRGSAFAGGEGELPVARLLETLRSVYPPERLLTEPARLAPYESDALTAFRRRPEAVVLAETRDEVIATVRACHAEQVPFVARGSGTSLSGGSLPVEGGIVIGLNRLNRVLRLDAQERIAVVEPGVINAHVSRAAAAHGLFYAPDPSSQQICTIGGNIAFNSGGAHCLKHGMTASHVLAVEAVLPDGEVVRLGSGGPEPAGPDWLGGFVGSEGLFGIALEATLKLLPIPEATHTVLAAYPDLRAAGDAVAAVVAAGLLPVAMEIMDELAIEAAQSSVRPGYPDVPALLIVELDGERDCVDDDVARLAEVIRASGATEVRATEDAAERAMIWKGRKSAFSAVGWLAPDYLVQDGCVPRTRLGEALEEIGRMAARAGLRVANVFHAGDGNLHPLILFDGREPGAVERAEALAGEILDLCIALGGSITGEHGVGVEKREYLARMFGPADIGAMRRLHRAIDPLQLANRGKMFPAGEPAPRRDLAAAPEGVDAIVEAVRAHSRVLPRGSGTKPALSNPPDDAFVLDVSGLRGIVEYDPDELTLTALAGTPISEVQAALAAHGQHLPFDPPPGTIGGTVAAGVSGPGRYRHGGVRDFILGARFVDGTGAFVGGGGRVVKNAAGFDLPRLLVGSMGRLGVLVEVAFKVFPAPPATATLIVEAADLAGALDAMARAAGSGVDIEALDLEPPSRLLIRVGGPPAGLERRLQRLRRALALPGDIHRDDQPLWQPPPANVRAALSPRSVAALDRGLDGVARRYSAGGALGWIDWPADRPLGELDGLLRAAGAGAVRLAGPPGPALLGRISGDAFGERVRRGLDPDGRFAVGFPEAALVGV